MFAAVYFLWRYFDAPSRPRLAIAAAAFGLAQLTKATAILLVPILALILLVRALWEARQRRGTSTGPALEGAASTLPAWKEAASTLARAGARSCALFALFGIVTVV